MRAIMKGNTGVWVMTDFNVLLFDGFETLDAFGPVDVMGRLGALYRLGYYSRYGGVVASQQGMRVQTARIAEMDRRGVLLVPGGQGIRRLVEDKAFLSQLLGLAEDAAYVLAVCTGAALVAATGFLDGRCATTGKRAFHWVQGVRPQVQWVKKARWVVDGKCYTASGVAAGIDMVLGFVRDVHGMEAARGVCEEMAYKWHMDEDTDATFP